MRYYVIIFIKNLNISNSVIDFPTLKQIAKVILQQY